MCFVDQRVPAQCPGEEVLLVVRCLAERFHVGGEITDGVDQAVAVTRDPGEVRGEEVSAAQVFPEFFYIFSCVSVAFPGTGISSFMKFSVSLSV